MRLQVCHASDLHGRQIKLPWADLYLVTGDMIANTSWCMIDREMEAKMQSEFIQRNPLTPFLVNQQAKVVCLRGNHDYTDLLPYFAGMETYELHEPEDVVELFGLRIGGCRGIKTISKNNRGSSFWNDEYDLPDLDDRYRRLPVLDVVLTHTAPYDVLDNVDEEHIGSPALASYLMRHQPKLICFGHIHECFGVESFAGVICSNAATGYQMLELYV